MNVETIELATWTAPGCPWRIEFPPALLEEINAATVESFYALQRGGLEIGGVLLGTRDRGVLRIAAFRQIPCEYALGPSFKLSAKDEAGLRSVLEEPRDGLEPLGWFHSHTRSDISLSEHDLDLYNRFFPKRWQVALVLRPAHLQKTRAGFFYRDAEGRVESAKTAREFPIDPDFMAAMNGVAETEVAPARNSTVTEIQYLAPVRVPPPAPQVLEPRPVRKHRMTASPLAIAVALIAGIAGGAGALYCVQRPGAEPIDLQTTDVNGQMLIHWNRTAASVNDAGGATLEIDDGGRRMSVPLDYQRLHEGVYRYARKSGQVEVSLLVPQEGGEPERRSASYRGPLPAPDRMELLQAEIESKDLEIRRLAYVVRMLRQQLRDERDRERQR